MAKLSIEQLVVDVTRGVVGSLADPDHDVVYANCCQAVCRRDCNRPGGLPAPCFTRSRARWQAAIEIIRGKL